MNRRERLVNNIIPTLRYPAMRAGQGSDTMGSMACSIWGMMEQFLDYIDDDELRKIVHRETSEYGIILRRKLWRVKPFWQ